MIACCALVLDFSFENEPIFLNNITQEGPEALIF